jgi:hypothetical protein
MTPLAGSRDEFKGLKNLTPLAGSQDEFKGLTAFWASHQARAVSLLNKVSAPRLRLGGVATQTELYTGD